MSGFWTEADASPRPVVRTPQGALEVRVIVRVDIINPGAADKCLAVFARLDVKAIYVTANLLNVVLRVGTDSLR